MLVGTTLGLPGGLGLDDAQAAAAAAVACRCRCSFPTPQPTSPVGAGTRVVAGRVDHDRGSADRDDVGRGGRIIHGHLVAAVAVGSAIARGGQEGDARCREVGVELALADARARRGRPPARHNSA